MFITISFQATHFGFYVFRQKASSFLRMNSNDNNKEECAICTEKMTPQRRKKIECTKCLGHACSVCYKTYFKDSFDDPHCMFCKHPWDMDFMNKMFTSHYMRTDWKKSRTDILFTREQSFFPLALKVIDYRTKVNHFESKVLVEIDRSTQELKTHRIKLRRRIRDLKEEWTKIYNKKEIKVIAKERDDIYFEIRHLKEHLDRQCLTQNMKDVLTLLRRHVNRRFRDFLKPLVRGYMAKKKWAFTVKKCKKIDHKIQQQTELSIDIWNLVWTSRRLSDMQVAEALGGGGDAPHEFASTFSNRTCITEGCKGILEKQTGHCVLCNHTTCLHCNVTRTNDEHECSPTDLETWKLIQQGSKPCPNCSILIFKSGGCDQMWCIRCHVAFSWKTGVVDNRRIHNPHYFEYLRANPHLENRNPEAEHMECELIWRMSSYPSQVRNNVRFSRMFEFLSHQVNDALPYYIEYVRERYTNIELDIKYLKKDITESVFKKRLVAKEQKKHLSQRLIDIYQTMEIISRNILSDVRETQDVDLFEIEYRKLIQFTNEQIEGLNGIYNGNMKLLEVPPL